MIRPGSLGPLIKAKETLKIFAQSAPSPAALLANRTHRFDKVHAILPSNASPGESVSLIVQAWDQCERLDPTFEETLQLDTTDAAATIPDHVAFEAASDGVTRVEDIEFSSPGIQYITVTRSETGKQFVSNPIRVQPEFERRLYWGDIHLHSYLSDGVGPPERGYEFGRDIMGLDVVAYTDHDTMGFFIPPTWQQRRMQEGVFDHLCALAEDYQTEGSFVTLPAYEWTKQPNRGGHINVYFEDATDAHLFDSISPESNSYEKLWDQLREWQDQHDSRVITIPHHPAESMYPFDFAAVDYDDDLAPLVEVYSQWGSSEQPGSETNPYPLAMGQGEITTPGHYVQDAHQMGYKVGMLGGGDYHGPAPGHSLIHTSPHLPSMSEWRDKGLGWANIWRIWNEASYPGGLTAFLAPTLSRRTIFDALESRAVYATTQPDRLIVDFEINGIDVARQPDQITVDTPDTPRNITVMVAGTAPIDTVTVVKNNRDWQTLRGTSNPHADLETYTAAANWQDTAPITGMEWDESRTTAADVYTLRVRQATADTRPGMAWVGPLWVGTN